MIKKIAFAAFAAASMSAFGQDDAMKYDTYQVGKMDMNSASVKDFDRIVKHDLKGVNANDAYTIDTFIKNSPGDISWVILKALANNYKQASMVRDEVAQARYGTSTDFAWLSYPPLTWSATPGQNSWSNVTMSDSGPMAMTSNPDSDVSLTDDSARAMRMVMRHNGRHDIDYDRTLEILGSGLNDTERGTLIETFHPTTKDPTFYTNTDILDSLTRVVESNAKMVGSIGRYAWYNHFDKDYYTRNKMDW